MDLPQSQGKPSSSDGAMPIPKYYLFIIVAIAVSGSLFSIYSLITSAMSGKTDDVWLYAIALLFFAVVLTPFIGHYFSMRSKGGNK